MFVACMQDMTEFAIMRLHLRIMTAEVYVILKTRTACKLTWLVPIVFHIFVNLLKQGAWYISTYKYCMR